MTFIKVPARLVRFSDVRDRDTKVVEPIAPRPPRPSKKPNNPGNFGRPPKLETK